MPRARGADAVGEQVKRAGVCAALGGAFAIRLLGVIEYPGLSVEELQAELGAFRPPQGYIRLACSTRGEKVAA